MTAAILGLIPAAAAAGVLADRPGRRRHLLMALALALAPVLIVADQWHGDQVAELRSRPVLALAAVVTVAVLVLGLALLVRRRPTLLAVLVVLALPFRIPLGVGGSDANLLVPLYLVTAAGVVAALIRNVPAATPAGDGRPSGPDRVLRLLPLLLAASILLYAVGIPGSADRSNGLLNLGFFLVPFAVLFALVTEIEWTAERLRRVGLAILLLALACALLALSQWAGRWLLWNEAVVQSNEFHVYFRVNSLFWDPNVFGRYLALAMLVGAAALAWSRKTGEALGLSGLLILLGAGLMVTFSQSSFISLLAGLAAVAALRWNLRRVGLALAGLAVVAVLAAVISPGTGPLDLGKINRQTSGRAGLVDGGIELFRDRPLFGYGSGAFATAFRKEIAGERAPVAESHTEPITVAAEQGVIGLALYLALVVVALAALSRGFRQEMPGLSASPAKANRRRGPPTARTAVFACFVAVLVHTISYAGFLDDPVTWVLLGIGCSLALPCRDTSADS